MPRVMSASNLRQIGQAILLYSNDHHGQYPDSFGTILLNEDITSAVFVSPTAGTAAVGPTTQAIAAQLVPGPHLSYVYLGNGLNIATVTPDTVVAYEIPSPTGANILFGDGHVEYCSPTSMNSIAQQVANGKFPTTLPAAR
jgi:prepilin-type processing-associated H-X9-DG protein